MANLRAFASCLVVAAVSAAGATSSANPVGMQFTGVISGSNANAPNGYGQVLTPYRMGKYEVTNAEYAAFLTATGTSRGTYDSRMSITGSAGVFTPLPGQASVPVTFVDWFDAARFVNWMVSGSTENGAYALNGSDVVVNRNPNAAYFLPSANEWMKAAFYNPGTQTYFTYATSNNTAPTPSAPNPTNTNAGNFSAIVGAPAAVNAYPLTKSPYDVYGALGNVTEMTDTSSAGNVIRLGGNWNNAATTSSTALSFLTPTTVNAQIGFRVAAVPEPETVTLAAFGIVGLCGANWLKRRRKAGTPETSDAMAIAA